MGGAIIVIFMLVTVLAGEQGLNRHTTIAVSIEGFLVAFILTVSLGAVLAIASHRRGGGLLQLVATDYPSAKSVRQRLSNVSLILFVITLVVAWWSWYAASLTAQYLPGKASVFEGIVTAVRDHVTGRQSCLKCIEMRTSRDAVVDVCYVAGPLFAKKSLASSPPQLGQRVSVITRESWFGTVADRLIF
jgi:hypothetical protein